MRKEGQQRTKGHRVRRPARLRTRGRGEREGLSKAPLQTDEAAGLIVLDGACRRREKRQGKAAKQGMEGEEGRPQRRVGILCREVEAHAGGVGRGGPPR